MEHHLELRIWIDDKHETKKEFIKRQTRIPCLDVNPKDYEFFNVRLLDLEDVKWNQTEPFHNRFWIYPEKESFLEGELIYRIDQMVYIKDKHLSKWGFKQKKEENSKVFYLTTPLKLYKKDSFLIVKKGSYRLDKVLRNNKLHIEKNRSKEFNDFLLKHNYIK